MYLIYLENKLNLQDEFESECFSMVKQIVDLKSFAILYLEWYPELKRFLTGYLCRVFREQCIKLRRLCIAQSDYLESEKCRKLKISCTCFIWMLHHLKFFLCPQHNFVDHQMSTCLTRLYEENQKDGGCFLTLEDLQHIAIYARRIVRTGVETCSCFKEENFFDQEGSFLQSFLDEDSYGHYNLPYQLNRFLIKLESRKGYCFDNFLDFEAIHTLIEDNFNFQEDLEKRDNSDLLSILNQFLTAFCILLTRTAITSPCCCVYELLEEDADYKNLPLCELFNQEDEEFE